MNINPASLMTDTARALGFLTRLPVPAHYFEGDDGNMSRTSRAFPLAGLIAALPSALLIYFAPWLGLPSLLAASLAIVMSIGVTGALHEDGLADVADGFFGGKTTEHRLAIMKDSGNGTYGSLALILSVLLRVAALASIASANPCAAALAVIASGVAGRTSLVWHWVELTSARPGGAADSAGQPDTDSLTFALILGVALSVLSSLFAVGVAASVLMLALVAVSAIVFARLCRDKIGGHTGDTLGASSQIAEIATLIALASAL